MLLYDFFCIWESAEFGESIFFVLFLVFGLVGVKV
jgi:hypothetical protein